MEVHDLPAGAHPENRLRAVRRRPALVERVEALHVREEADVRQQLRELIGDGLPLEVDHVARAAELGDEPVEAHGPRRVEREVRPLEVVAEAEVAAARRRDGVRDLAMADERREVRELRGRRRALAEGLVQRPAIEAAREDGGAVAASRAECLDPRAAKADDGLRVEGEPLQGAALTGSSP